MTNYNSYALKSLLQKEHIIKILESLGAHGINPNDSNGIRSSCPIHNSKGNTVLAYNPDVHLYNCYGSCSDENKDGDIIKLVRLANKCSYDDAVIFICDIAEIDIKIIENNEEWLLNELSIKLDNLLLEIKDNQIIEEDIEDYYGVKPIPKEIYSKLIGLKDDEGFIDSQGFSEATLTLFESGYDSDGQRWLLPQRSLDGELLGFDGRDITNKKKDKWRKRSGLLKNRLLGRLDIVKEYIEKENKVILCEGIKDQMSIFETGLKHTSCIYGSSLSKEQKDLIDSMIDDEIIVFADGDKAGYKFIQSVVKICYPEYLITIPEIEDGLDPAEISSKHLLELYENRIPVEEWLKKYLYRTKNKN